MYLSLCRSACFSSDSGPCYFGLWLKCIVGQSWAKLGKVDMFSKAKQSWQSWCIFLSIFKYNMQSKVGKVQIWIFYSRQRWQSWEIIFLINWNNSDPKLSWQSWQSWGYFWTNFASFYNRQSWQSWDTYFLINWNNSDPRQSWQSWGYFLDSFCFF